MILANRVPIEEDELVEQIIEGIPDMTLQNQARIQQFANKTSLLAAFEKVRLDTGEKSHLLKKHIPKREDSTNREMQSRRSEIKRRCPSCGGKDHAFADCPTKDKGRKCFQCREFGHILAYCPTKKPAIKDSYGVSKTSEKGKYCKDGRNYRAL
ncbi:hypothetical protein ANTPLA_LOCUS1928 [Anthophora plagiata]